MTRKRKKGSSAKKRDHKRRDHKASAISHILINCPITRKPLNTGFGKISKESFSTFEFKNNRSGPCPHCGQIHTWSKEDAFLEGEQPKMSRQPETMETVLILHQGVTLADTTIYLTGHAYRDCRFERCTLVITDGPSHVEGCVLDSCTVHLNVVLHDRLSVEGVRRFLGKIEGMFLAKGADSTKLPSSGVVSWSFGDAPPPVDGNLR